MGGGGGGAGASPPPSAGRWGTIGTRTKNTCVSQQLSQRGIQKRFVSQYFRRNNYDFAEFRARNTLIQVLFGTLHGDLGILQGSKITMQVSENSGNSCVLCSESMENENNPSNVLEIHAFLDSLLRQVLEKPALCTSLPGSLLRGTQRRPGSDPRGD